MTITEIAIRRPVFLLMIISMFIIFGLISLSRIGVSFIPNVDFPMVAVTAVYPGAGPEEIETTITKPVEDSVSTVNGLKHTQSFSFEGMSMVLLEFELNVDGNNARLDVQKKVDELKATFPDGVKDPMVAKWDLTAMPIMNLAVTSDQRPLDELYLIIDKQVKNRLQQVEGVAGISITGQKERQINITIDPDHLAQFGLSILDVIDTLRMHNLDVPAGLVETKNREFSTRLNGRFRTVEEIRHASIVTASGKEVHLENIANVVDSFKKQTSISRVNGVPCLGISVQQQPGSNSVRITDLIKNEIANLKTKLPADIKFNIAYEQATFTRNSISEVTNNLLEAILLTSIIIFIFLYNIRNTIIVLLAIPTSLIATFSLLYYSGFTVNMISLMGLAMTVGILVDDSIVVLENTDRHFKMGKSPFRAALDGRNEIGLAAISITMTDIAVFIPLAFMGGIIGRFFAQFGLTITFAILFSLFISFTLTPMLASRWLKRKGTNPKDAVRQTDNSDNKDEGLDKHKNRIMDSLRNAYGKMSNWALGHRKTVVAVTLIIFLISMSLVPLGFVGQEFFANVDQHVAMVEMETPAGTSLEKTDNLCKVLEAKIAAMPDVESYFSSMGTSSQQISLNAGNQKAQIKLNLHSGKGSRPTKEVSDDIRKIGSEIPGINLRVYPPDFLSGGESQLPIQIEVSGNETKDFETASNQIREDIKRVNGLIEISSTWKKGKPEIKADIDRVKCAALGIPAALVGQTLRASIDGDTTNKYKEADREYDMMVSLPDERKNNIDDISRIQLKTLAGQMVELGQVARIYQDFGPTEIRRKDRNRMFVVEANITGGRVVGDVSQDIKKILDKESFPPSIIRYNMGGEVEIMGDSFYNLILALFLSIIFVYMIMASLFESFVYPFIIMFAIPLTAIGAILGLIITHKTLNVMSMIGMVMLVGLVVHNGILLIDYTNTLRKRGYNRHDALVEAGRTRLRPILMTTLALIFGMLPLAMSLGPGSEMRSGMGVVIMGGMISSTLLTLIFIPVVYTIVDDSVVRTKKIFGMKTEPMKFDEPSN
jgi:hydrophobic/amphiphilic exporter-1 (mainly G- bacteria), HAE1 family